MRPSSASAEPTACAHCGQPSNGARYCCNGCAQVAALQAQARDGQAGQIRCAIEGMHCGACVSVIETMFNRQPGAEQITINPALGQATLRVDAARFDFAAFARALAAIGYRIAETQTPRLSENRSLLLRMGVCLALAGNSMAFSFAVYFGLREGLLHQVVGFINFALATLVLAIGGTYFIANAVRALKASVWHVDVPLALSVVLAYGGATYVFFATGFGPTYFDTFCAYVALMLLGKYLPARLIETNRATLLNDDGLGALPQSKLVAGKVQRTVAETIDAGEVLLVLPGDLLTVEARLLDAFAMCSLDWLTGEPMPVRFARGELVPAGAFNAGDSAFRVQATTNFKSSKLKSLLGAERREDELRTAQQAAVQRFSKLFVASVLGAAAVTFAGWALFDVRRAVWATVCVLVVACPCPIGLGSPLALELVLRRLRKAGVFVRRQETLAKLAEVNAIAFDKTGTLTELRLANEAELQTLASEDRRALATMAAHSNHPAARALRRPEDVVSGAEVTEVAGTGLQMGTYRLTRVEGSAHVLELTRDGERLCTLALDEALRLDAASEVQALANAGFRLSVLSGDRAERVASVTAALPIAQARCLGGLQAEQKAEWLAAHDEKVLMLGDGVNDLPAFAAAFCSATPAIDRPFVPARADFYYRARGLRPIGDALRAARAYARAERINYGFALVYNLLVLGVAAAGLMTPLLAALLMPSSSLAIVGLNVLLAKETAWKSF